MLYFRWQPLFLVSLSLLQPFVTPLYAVNQTGTPKTQNLGDVSLFRRDTTFSGCDSKQESDLSGFMTRGARKLRLARTSIDDVLLNNREEETRFLRNFGGYDEDISKLARKWIDDVISPMSRRSSVNFEISCQSQDPRCRENVPDRDGNDSPISGYIFADAHRKRIMLCPSYWGRSQDSKKKETDLLWLLLSFQNPEPRAYSTYNSLETNIRWQSRYFKPSINPRQAVTNPYAMVNFINDVARTFNVLFRRLQSPPARIDPTGQRNRLIPDDFVVYLRRGSLLRDHFDWIGADLSRIRDVRFRYYREDNAYRIRVARERVTGLLVYDPTVERVLQNAAFDHGFSDRDRIEKRAPARERRPRVSQRAMPWFAKMLTIERRQPIDREWYHDGRYLEEGGMGVQVYVLDSGIRWTHELFVPNAENQGGVRNFHRAHYSNPLVPLRGGQLLPMDDDNGHGSHIAGIVKFNANNCTIVNVKISVGGQSTVFSAWEAMEDVRDEHLSFSRRRPPDWRGSVVNLSSAPRELAPAGTAMLQKSLQRLEIAGIPVSVAAGNQKSPDTRALCNWQTTVCVAACNREYQRWESSNFGRSVSIIAPGEDITSASHSSDREYVTGSGTSMAAPAVAGIMAIFVSYERNNNRANRARYLLYENALKNVNMGGFGRATEFPWLANTGIREPPFIKAYRRRFP